MAVSLVATLTKSDETARQTDNAINTISTLAGAAQNQVNAIGNEVTEVHNAGIQAVRQADATTGQLKYLKQQVRDAHESYVQSNRAFVFIPDLQPEAVEENTGDDVTTWSFYAIVRNTGNTQTKNMVIRGDYSLDTPNMGTGRGNGAGFPVDDKRVQTIQKDDVPPNGDITYCCLYIKVELMDILQKVRHPYFYVWLRGNYNDIFVGTKCHHFQVAFVVNIVGDVHHMPAPHALIFKNGIGRYRDMLDGDCENGD